MNSVLMKTVIDLHLWAIRMTIDIRVDIVPPTIDIRPWIDIDIMFVGINITATINTPPL